MRHGRAEEAKSYARLAYEHAKLAYGESHCITLLAARGMVEPMLHSEERRTGWLHELGMGNVACIVS